MGQVEVIDAWGKKLCLRLHQRCQFARRAHVDPARIDLLIDREVELEGGEAIALQVQLGRAAMAHELHVGCQRAVGVAYLPEILVQVSMSGEPLLKGIRYIACRLSCTYVDPASDQEDEQLLHGV